MPLPTCKSILIVVSDVEGHRQNYAAVLGRWFAEANCAVGIACGHGVPEMLAAQAPVLAQFVNKSAASVFNLEDSCFQDAARFRERLSQLETDLRPAWTLLVNGEACVRALGGEWPRNSDLCRRAGVFIYFPHQYPLDLRPYSSFRKCRPLMRHLRERYRQRRFFRSEVWPKLGLDLVLSTDEYSVEAIRHLKVRYLPDIYRAWGSELWQEPPETIEQARADYANFLRRHPTKEVILFYGWRCLRRGYDSLLALAFENEDTIFVSVGRPPTEKRLIEIAGTLEPKLKKQDRLFHLDLPFLPENAFIDDLFRSTRYIVLPYRDWYGLAGSLVQPTSYGRPVLVPDIGAMAGTVRRYGIGLTYRHLDFQHLRLQFRALRDDPMRFRDKAICFSRRLDYQAVSAALAAAFKWNNR